MVSKISLLRKVMPDWASSVRKSMARVPPMPTSTGSCTLASALQAGRPMMTRTAMTKAMPTTVPKTCATRPRNRPVEKKRILFLLLRFQTHDKGDDPLDLQLGEPLVKIPRHDAGLE